MSNFVASDGKKVSITTTWSKLCNRILTLVTQQASPAFLAVALPRQLARAVLAGRVLLALVAERALPTVSASAKRRI